MADRPLVTVNVASRQITVAPLSVTLLAVPVLKGN